MSNIMSIETFEALRVEFPGYSPAALFDVACERMEIRETWETTSLASKFVWMDAFTNAPTSNLVH